MSQSERQLEASAQNVANATTPGYKRHFTFAQAVEGAGVVDVRSAERTGLDLSPGKLINTGGPLDLALSGKGFFVVGSSDRPSYTRSGQFQRSADGRLITAQGLAVQADGGGDILLKSDAIKVLDDGTILDQGEPSAKLAIVDFDNPSLVTSGAGGVFVTPSGNVRPLAAASVHQGMLEASNASTADDMLSTMEALRRAETGQRLANLYDDLMGRVLSSVGQSG